MKVPPEAGSPSKKKKEQFSNQNTPNRTDKEASIATPSEKQRHPPALDPHLSSTKKSKK